MSGFLCKKGTNNCYQEVCVDMDMDNDAILKKCFMCNNTTKEEFNEAWRVQDCNKSLDPPPNKKTDPDELKNSQLKANRVLVVSMGENGENLDVKGNNLTQNKVLNICKGGATSSSPNACGNYLEFILSKNESYTYNMMGNIGIANWLGCFIPPPPDEKNIYDEAFQDSIKPDQLCQLAGVEGSPCYPMCHRISTVQKYASRKACTCNSNVCVIDDISVTASDINVNFNITQICPSCTKQNPCTCITSSTDLEDTFSELGISSTFNQICNPNNSVCYDIVNDNLIQQDCQLFLKENDESAFSTALPVFIIVGGIIIFIIVISVMFSTKDEKIIVKPKKKKEKKITDKKDQIKTT